MTIELNLQLRPSTHLIPISPFQVQTRRDSEHDATSKRR